MSSSETNNERQNENESNEAKDELKLVLTGAHNTRVSVLCKKSTKISKLLNTYCQKFSVNSGEHRLIYKGKVLQENETVDGYSIQNGAIVEVVASQVGGWMFL